MSARIEEVAFLNKRGNWTLKTIHLTVDRIRDHGESAGDEALRSNPVMRVQLLRASHAI